MIWEIPGAVAGVENNHVCNSFFVFMNKKDCTICKRIKKNIKHY